MLTPLVYALYTRPNTTTKNKRWLVVKVLLIILHGVSRHSCILVPSEMPLNYLCPLTVLPRVPHSMYASCLLGEGHQLSAL